MVVKPIEEESDQTLNQHLLNKVLSGNIIRRLKVIDELSMIIQEFADAIRNLSQTYIVIDMHPVEIIPHGTGLVFWQYYFPIA